MYQRILKTNLDCQTLTSNNADNSFLIYGGDRTQKRKYARVLSWNSVDAILES